MTRIVLACIVLSLPALIVGDTPGSGEWKYDIVHRKSGEPLVGLVVEQSETKVKIRCISRKRGSPTVVITQIINRSEVKRLELLGDAERKILEGRLDALKREREVLNEHLRLLDPKAKGKSREEDADLREIAWPPDDKVKALAYESTYFHLIVNSRGELAQLLAIHLEQVYSAYARSLPPRTKGTPTTILVTRSLAEYQTLAKSRGLNLFNPAFYDPGRNQVVCGSDLERLRDELERVRQEHAQLRGTIKERRAELMKVYKGKVPKELLEPFAEAEKAMKPAEDRNDAAFAQVRQRLFRRLYHEAFHAYLNTFVYPAKDGPLPHWFNEGLAQIFETAIVEVGELRVGHTGAGRLRSVREALARNELLGLKELLRSTPQKFLVAHAKDQQVSDRLYLASWALAFYLTFDRKLLGTKKLDTYVQAIQRETDAVAAFRDLVGEPLEAFEKAYREYLTKLKSDGTTAK